MSRLKIVDLLNSKTFPPGQSKGLGQKDPGRQGITFIALYDGSALTTLQVVAESPSPDFETCRLATGSAITVEGTLRNPLQGQAVELVAEKMS